MIREAQIHFGLHHAIMNAIGKKHFDQIEFDRTEPEYPIRGIGRADLVLLDKEKRVWLVIETKSSLKANDPYSPKVIDQAMRYANWLGSYYFATCDGHYFVLFDNREKGATFWERKRIPPYNLRKEKNLNTFAEKLLQDIVNLETGNKKWSQPDEAFIERLRILHQRIVPYINKSLMDKITNDEGFAGKYKNWLEKQGFHLNKDTNQKIAIEAAYLLVNKILFYKVLETKYSELPRLTKVGLLLDPTIALALRRKLVECFEKALKIDYQAVFQQGIYDEIDLPEKLTHKLNEFLEEASEYDLSKIQSDVLGTIYEGLIPKEERHKLGQYYTPPAICDLIVRMCIKNQGDFVLDPAVGSGGFLIKAYYRLLELKGSQASDTNAHEEVVKQLWGVDISQFPAHLAVINLALRNIKANSDMINIIPSDFFRILAQQKILKPLQKITLQEMRSIHDLPPQFDSVVCNPPYTRQDDIGDEKYRIHLREVALSSDKKIEIGLEAGIYAYFFTHSAHFLKQKGMFGYIVSNSWLDAKFGVSIQRFFLEHFKISAIIEFDKRSFTEAAVNTVIIIAQKLEGTENQNERNNNSVRFTRIKTALKIEAIVNNIESADDSYEDEDIRIVIKKQKELSEDPKWMKFLRAPPIFSKLLSNPKMSKLEDFAKVNVGIITYANNFFVIPKDQENKLGIEKRFLRRVISNTKDVRTLDLVTEDAKEYLFFTNESKSDLKDTNALRYIEENEKKPIEITRGTKRGKVVVGYQNIPSFSGKPEWFKMKARKPAPILVPDLMWERNFAVLNEAGVMVTHAFYEITPNDKTEAVVIAGILNSTLAALCEEIWGRTALGEGAIRMMAHEWQTMPIPNPDKLNKNSKKKITNAFRELCDVVRKQDKDSEEKIREKLDDAVFESVNLTSKQRKDVIDSLKELREMRKHRIDTEVLIKHPETKRKAKKKKVVAKTRFSENPLDKWVK